MALTPMFIGLAANADFLEDFLDKQRHVDQLIGSTAQEICNVVNAAGTSKTSKVREEVQNAMDRFVSEVRPAGYRIDKKYYLNEIQSYLNNSYGNKKNAKDS